MCVSVNLSGRKIDQNIIIRSHLAYFGFDSSLSLVRFYYLDILNLKIMAKIGSFLVG